MIFNRLSLQSFLIVLTYECTECTICVKTLGRPSKNPHPKWDAGDGKSDRDRGLLLFAALHGRIFQQHDNQWDDHERPDDRLGKMTPK